MGRRVLSETGYYHVTTRTAGQIAMFEDDEDRRYYLQLLKAACDETGTRILAWVLMTDHVHLVVDVGMERSVGAFMLLVDAPYSRFFNRKTGRSGTLYQDRFWSKPIRTEGQLVATVHYVHCNPEKAGMTSMREYPWSSYREYVGNAALVDTSTVLGIFGSVESFAAFDGEPNEVVRRRHRVPIQDGDVLREAMRMAGVATSDELRSLPHDKRNAIVGELAAQGVSTRKIARAFGIGASTVSRLVRSLVAR